MVNLFILFQLFFHPFHVSVCEINLEPDDKNMEITQKIFLDDLEMALNQHFDAKYQIDDLIEEEKLEGILATYVMEKFSVTADNKPVAIEFLGIEADVESVWCYLSGEIPKKKVNKVAVTTQLLTETFDDQINLVHLTVNGDIQSEKLGTEEIIGFFEIED